MKHTHLTRTIKNCLSPLLFAFAIMFAGEFRAHALYQVGQTVTNFSFVARRPFTRPDGTSVPAGARVYIKDFSGRIVFLEWFAVWCPFCVAAAPQVEAGIVDWYEARGGNPYGVPVLHIAVNQEPSTSYQTATDNFINQQGFGIVMNDYATSGSPAVRFQFQNGGQPIFAVINGVTNSPTHQPWQVLVNHLGYGDTDFNQELAAFRAVIDTVQPSVPRPTLSAPRRIGLDFEFTMNTQTGRTYRVQASTNLVNWTTIRTITGSANPIAFRDTNAPPTRRFYRAVTP